MKLIQQFFTLSILIIFICATVSALVPCGSNCSSDYDCTQDETNPCTFCLRGVCSPMCGIGCRSDEDCLGKGEKVGYSANPCTHCSDEFICTNPVPMCGSFCGFEDAACFVNGTTTGSSAICARGAYSNQKEHHCCQCHPTNLDLGCGNWNVTNCQSTQTCRTDDDCKRYPGECTHCNHGECQKKSSMCGTVCQSDSECLQGDSSNKCTQCIGFFCSQPSSSNCGKVCISSGQCTGGECGACIGATCQKTRPCGGSCGDDSWCSSSCPVCGHIATCVSHEEYAREKEEIKTTLK